MSLLVPKQKEREWDDYQKKKKKKTGDKDGEMKDGYTNQDILSQGSIYFTPSQHPIRFHIKEQWDECRFPT